MDARKGFLVSVELRYISSVVGEGVFCLERVQKGAQLWIPNMVEKILFSEVPRRLECLSRTQAHEFLRQGFVLASDLDFLCVNVNDLGRFTNHSPNPNMGYADGSPYSVALRDIEIGEELSCDYSGLASPMWYKNLCQQYDVTPTDKVAELFR